MEASAEGCSVRWSPYRTLLCGGSTSKRRIKQNGWRDQAFNHSDRRTHSLPVKTKCGDKPEEQMVMNMCKVKHNEHRNCTLHREKKDLTKNALVLVMFWMGRFFFTTGQNNKIKWQNLSAFVLQHIF